MTEPKNPLATVLGNYYPTHYVVAAVDDPSRAAQALTALREAGFSDATAQICPGPQFLKNYQDFIDHRGTLARVAAAFPSEEQSAIAEYLEEAERGSSFVTVHTPERAKRDEARDLLKAHGGHAMRYYGDHAITDLS
jgi:hypothetical protein